MSFSLVLTLLVILKREWNEPWKKGSTRFSNRSTSTWNFKWKILSHNTMCMMRLRKRFELKNDSAKIVESWTQVVCFYYANHLQIEINTRLWASSRQMAWTACISKLNSSEYLMLYNGPDEILNVCESLEHLNEIGSKVCSKRIEMI